MLEEKDGKVKDAAGESGSMVGVGDNKKTNGGHAGETTRDPVVSASSDFDATSGSASLVAESASGGDRKFELRDLNILFPHGELTVVTGPTASGKTALLVRRVSSQKRVDDLTNLPLSSPSSAR